MPRKARKDLSSSFAHVMVQGINKEYIFSKDNYKNKYLHLLFSNIKNYNENLISFCIMDNHAHMVLHYQQPKDVSALMHTINTAYAKWYNDKNGRVGYVFRDRYKVEEIKDLHHLYSCIKYVHNNPVKAGIVSNPLDYLYSSYKEYQGGYGIFNSKLLEILQMSEKEIESIILNQNDIDTEYDDSLNFQKEIDKFIKNNGIKSIAELNKSDSIKELILFLKNTCKMKNKDITKLLNMSRTTIYRILYK